MGPVLTFQFDVRFEVVNEDDDLLIQAPNDVEEKKVLIEEKRRKAAELRKQKLLEKQRLVPLFLVFTPKARGVREGRRRGEM